MKFSIFNCKIRVSFLFVALITGSIILDSSASLFWGILAALVHELGHIFAMVFEGDRPSEIKFNLFDIAIVDNKREKRSYCKDIFILSAGPIVNIVFFAIFYGLFLWIKWDDLYGFAIQNLLLGGFNTLPIESLDGGQILYILFLKKLNHKKAQLLVQVISFLILLPLAILGFLILLQSRYNFSLLMVSLYLMAIILIKRGNFI
mgnify:FL=1